MSAYILIFVLSQTGQSNYSAAASGVEFASLPACQAAVAELTRQLAGSTIQFRAIMCAKKG